MVLKSPYYLDDQIYEQLVQCSDLAILPEELPAMYILPCPLSAGLGTLVRHQGLRETWVAFTGA